MTFSTYEPGDLEYDDQGFAKAMPTERCDNYPSEQCGGETYPRTSRSGLTHSLKCDGCQAALDDRLDEIDRRYPDSPIAPSWFDPTYAGEHWDSEDY